MYANNRLWFYFKTHYMAVYCIDLKNKKILHFSIILYFCKSLKVYIYL